jgi:type 1 glutamine amidotransferase
MTNPIHTMPRTTSPLKFIAAALVIGLAPLTRGADTKPLKVMLITGGCCHDYPKQKDILKKGIEERANAVVDQIHTDDKSTKPPLPIYGNPDYAKGYDVVIHDECSAGVADLATIDDVLKPHKDGIPAVNLHCAMHCYRFGDYSKPVPAGADNSHWYEYLGLQTIRHGKQLPIALTFLDPASPITKGMQNWTTINEELYNNIKVWDDAKPLARGKQEPGDKLGDNDTVVVWTHEYGPKKTRVFSTTIGHNNATVEDPRYLDLVTRGLLWAAGHLNDDGKPAKGYGPGGK